MSSRWLHPALIASLALIGCTSKDPKHGPQPAHHNGASNGSAIDSSSVATLRPMWRIDTQSPVTHKPLVEGARIWFADWNGMVYCSDAKTGQAIWSKQVEDVKKDRPWSGFCGTGALADGMLYEASAEGNAFAINAATGEVRWKRALAPGQEYAGHCGTLLHHDGLLYVGLSSIEEGVALEKKDFKPSFRGRVIALDAKNGRKVWEFFTVDPPGNGAAVWGSFAIDPETKTLFFGTGNNYTGKATLMSDAIVAVNSRTGELRWSHQLTANDVWTMKDRIGPDYDFAAGPQLFEGDYGDGVRRKLVGAGQKSGVYHALERDSGRIAWQTVVGHGEIAGGIMADAVVSNGRIYVWSNNGYDPAKNSTPPMTIKALDTRNGAPAWTVARAQHPGATSAGAISWDVYFVGSLDGHIVAYRLEDGERLWTSPAGGAPVGSSLTVAGDMLYCGGGVPKMFGGKDDGRHGVYAYGRPLSPAGR